MMLELFYSFQFAITRFWSGPVLAQALMELQDENNQ